MRTSSPFFLIEVEGHIGNVQRTRKITGDGVEEDLYSLVLIGGTHENGRELEGEGPIADGVVEQLFRDAIFEDGLGEIVRKERNRVEQFFALLLGQFHQFGGNLPLDDIVAEVAPEGERLHGDQVHDTFVRRLDPDGNLQENRVVVQFLLELGG